MRKPSIQLLLLLVLTGCGLPTVLVRHSMPKNNFMTDIVLASYTSPEKSATLFAKVKILERFPSGMTRIQAESIGLECESGTPVACRYSGVVTQEMVGIGKFNFQDGSKKREITVKIDIPDASSIESSKFSSTTKIIE